jgi:hypothetical protein
MTTLIKLAGVAGIVVLGALVIGPALMPHREAKPTATVPPRAPTAAVGASPVTRASPARAEPAAPPPVAATAPASATPVAHPERSRTHPRDAVTDARAASAAQPSNGDPGAELELLRNARAALAHAPARTLGLATEHAQRFPDGTFAEEREALAIEALVRLGREPAARARAHALGARFPLSAYARRIESLLAAEPDAQE